MKKQARIGIVIAAALLVAGIVATLANEAKADPHYTVTNTSFQIATDPPSSLSPDLSKVDPLQFLDPIPVGHKAPDFKVKDARGKDVQLSNYIGKKNVVLLFYSGSFCPVCGKQLSNVQSHLTDFEKQDAEIIAVSADDVQHAQKTVGEHGLSFPVIPDSPKDLIKKFGVSNITREGMAWPSSFIIDKKGIVRLSVADPKGKRLHSNELLPALSKITGKPAPRLQYDQ